MKLIDYKGYPKNDISKVGQIKIGIKLYSAIFMNRNCSMAEKQNFIYKRVNKTFWRNCTL